MAPVRGFVFSHDARHGGGGHGSNLILWTLMMLAGIGMLIALGRMRRNRE